MKKFSTMSLDEKLEVVKQGNDEDLDILVKDPYLNVHYAVAIRARDKDLDILINDKNWVIREAVTYQGRDKDLDILVNDEDYRVRYAVAYQGRDKDLDILVNDENYRVRIAVAYQGRDKDLDILVNDPSLNVRYAVAYQGRDKDLDILVNDQNEYVREAVAYQGRDKDLDILANDLIITVRDEALKQKEFKRYNGFTKNEIEENLKSIIKEHIEKYYHNINVIDVKVYGSRTRDSLYNYYSDLDIAVSYNGNLKEDILFNTINDELKYLDAPNGRLKLDINPINEEVSGTMEDFLDRSEFYLDRKEKKMLLNQNKEKKNIICLDTETTGLDPYMNEMLQLSIINGEYKTLFNEYFKPEIIKSWESAEAVNKISPEFVSDKKHAIEYLSEIQNIIDEADIIVGYNTNFDLKFLSEIGIQIPEKTEIIDVMKDFAEIYGEYNEHYGGYKWQKLTKCADYYGFDWECTGIPAHNSLGDCHATLYSYKKMNERKQSIAIQLSESQPSFKKDNTENSLKEPINKSEHIRDNDISL